MDFNDITIADVEAALASLEKTPVPEGENPFWHNRNVDFLRNFLEFLKAKAS